MHVKGTLAQVVELNSSSGFTESGDRTKWSREGATSLCWCRDEVNESVGAGVQRREKISLCASSS
jgi:hypothetical protein